MLSGGEIVPKNWLNPEDIDAVQDLFVLFETNRGNQYLCQYEHLEDSYFQDYTFIAPVICTPRGSGGYAVFMVASPDKVYSARFKSTTASASNVVVKGVLAASSSAVAQLDYYGHANMEQIMMYYDNFLNMPDVLDAMLMAKNIILNGIPCHPTSFGELRIIISYFNLINRIFNLAGLPTFTNYLFGSSTIHTNATYIWRTSGASSFTTGNKNTAYNMIPVADINVNFKNSNIKPVIIEFTPSVGNWTIDEDGYYVAPILSRGQTSQITLAITCKAIYSRFRLRYKATKKAGQDVYFGALGAPVSTSSYYFGLTGTNRYDSFFDYVINSVGNDYIRVLTNNTITGDYSADIRFKVEQIL